jgi:hypothetical protein
VAARVEPFGMVLQRTWRDPAFQQLGTDARLLFLWTLTGDRGAGAATAGLFRATRRDLVGALGEPLDGWAASMSRRLHFAVHQLQQKPLVLWDEDASLLWVVNRARHANRSPEVAAMIRRQVERMPQDSPLVDRFRSRYRGLLAS